MNLTLFLASQQDKRRHSFFKILALKTSVPAIAERLPENRNFNNVRHANDGSILHKLERGILDEADVAYGYKLRNKLKLIKGRSEISLFFSALSFNKL